MPLLLDADRLLAFVTRGRTSAKSNVVRAVYDGLEQRINRGDFTHQTPGTTAGDKTAPESADTLTRDLDNHLDRRRPS